MQVSRRTQYAAFNSHETQGIETLIRHSCTSFVLYRRQHSKRPITAAVSNRHTEIDISGPKVVENFRYTGRPLGPGPWGFSLASLMDDPALPIAVRIDCCLYCRSNSCVRARL